MTLAEHIRRMNIETNKYRQEFADTIDEETIAAAIGSLFNEGFDEQAEAVMNLLRLYKGEPLELEPE